jgi:8-oxo-dGTP diphosphatase
MSKIEVIARGIVIRGREVLLCKNRERGYYYLPGGHVEPLESAAAALVREMREECGEEVVVSSCVAVDEHIFVQRGKRRHEINITFNISLQRDSLEQVQSREPHIDFTWVSLDDLPHHDLRPTHARELIVAAARGETQSWTSHT